MKANHRMAVVCTATLLLFPLALSGCTAKTESTGTTEEGETELVPDEGLSASGVQSAIVGPLTSTYVWRNRSNKDLPYTRVITQPWVTASGPSSGVLMRQTDLIIEVTLDEELVNQLPVGTHQSQIRYLKPNMSAYRTIDITVTVDPVSQGYSMNLQPPSGLTSIGPTGGSVTPMSRSYTWANNGVAPIVYSRTISAPWVTVTGGNTGTVPNGEQIGFNVALTTQVLGFAAGSYNATVQFTETGSTTVVQTIPVVLTIQNAASVLTPSGGLVASGPVAGPFTPASQAYNWSNPGTLALPYERTVSQPWVSVTSPTSGTLGSGQSLAFTVALNASLAAGLPAGTHNAEVRFRSSVTTSVTYATVPITLTVTSGGGTTGAIDLNVVISDSNIWRTHAPGSTFQVNVSVSGSPLGGTAVNCQWVNEHRQPIGSLIPVSTTPTAIQSPSGNPGFIGLVFTSPSSQVRFLPQPRGFPSAVYGFAVLPNPPSGTPVIDEASPFGLLQGNINDPYLKAGSGPRVIGVHLKTKTWSQSVSTWGSDIHARTALGQTEMPLISGTTWDSVDTQPIPTTQLDQIGTKFRNVLQAEPNQVEYWQASLEENGGGSPYAQSHYFSNLLAKITRLRSEADAINPNVKFTYSTRGFDLIEFQQLFASQAFRDYYDGLCQDPYKWPDFPTPEGWLPGHISDVRTRMNNAGCAGHFFWFGEIGLPARGTNDPQAFFGYPETQDYVPGSTLDYYARYLVKVHALAIAHGIPRLHWYNYRNRGNDVDYAEHHFGLRSYTTSSSDPGHPFPGYVAYITMLSHLKGCSFVAMRRPSSTVWVFEFLVDGTTQRRLLAWVNASQSVTMALNSVKTGLLASQVQTVSDIYGRAVSAISSQDITLGGMPLFLRL